MSEWVAPQVQRVDPDRISDERTSLEQWLDFHRSTLLMKCAGLTAEQLKQRAVPPSRLSLLGLVRHMTEVERWWFRMHVAGEDVGWPYLRDGREDADMEELQDADAEANLTAYREEIADADAAARGHDLDEVVASRGDHKDRRITVRWIYFHMLEEYARHNGHADLLRERIDGATGD